MKKFKVYLFLFVLVLFSQKVYSAPVELILDVSGSMNTMLGSQKRIDAARSAIASALQSMPDSSIVALRLYGHRVPHTDKVKSCQDSELVLPFGPVQKSQIQGLINLARPLGETPLAYSLQLAAKDFSSTQLSEGASIILVSDGEESCGGNPLQVAADLIKQGFKLKIHTIGIDVNAVAKSQLTSIAQATGGSYRDAKDAASLSQSLTELTQEALLVKKTNSTYGDALRGGDSYETAVLMPTGKLLHLDHHQRVNQFDYFYVEVGAGQQLKGLIQTSQDGIEIRSEDRIVSVERPYAGMSIHSPARVELKREEIIGEKNSKKNIIIPEGKGGRYYILIGSIYEAQNKDQNFQIDLVNQYDANSSTDAGENPQSALAIALGTYSSNYLSQADMEDYYKLEGMNGKNLEIKARASVASEDMNIRIIDSAGVELAQARSPNAGAEAQITSVAINSSPVYLIVGKSYAPAQELPYTFSVQLSSVAPSNNSTNNNTNILNPSSINNNVALNTTLTNTADAYVATKNFASMLYQQIGFLSVAKFFLLYLFLPALFIFLFGYLLGYFKGKRKVKIQQMISSTPPQAGSTTTH